MDDVDYFISEEKHMKKKTVIFALSTFIILVIVEMIVVNRIDHGRGEKEFDLVVSIPKQLEKIGLEETEEVYSELLGRSLTKEEVRQENIINLQHSLTICSNVFYADDICLPDGSWILSDHVITARLYTESKEMLYVTVDSPELVKAYNAYADQSEYAVRTDWVEGRNIKNTFYYVVLERFYLDGLRVIPEKASIYRIDQEEYNTERKSSVTLADSLTCETGNVDNLPCYELEEGQDTSSLTYLTKFKYMCASEQKETSLMIGLVSGQESSLTERREVLEKLVSGKHVSGKRDLIGIPEYHTTVIRQDVPYYGGEVSIVLANRNVNYQIYKMFWIVGLILLIANVVITGILTGVRALIVRKKGLI